MGGNVRTKLGEGQLLPTFRGGSCHRKFWKLIAALTNDRSMLQPSGLAMLEPIRECSLILSSLPPIHWPASLQKRFDMFAKGKLHFSFRLLETTCLN
jgi:hypothetical protein